MVEENEKMKEVFSWLYWVASAQFGIDPRRFGRSLKGIPRYVSGWLRFRKGFNGKIKLRPCLYDWYEEGGSTRNEYFLQDLYVAQKIHRGNPKRHVDIGSRVDGFVAHIASFREIEVFDIRPITSQIPGVVFSQADLMSPTNLIAGYCDSLSCLHALEHFGLGRYGDPIDPKGSDSGLTNMAKILQPSGLFYLSVPIGRERVEFNAHRVFNPLSLIQLAAENGLVLTEFASIGPDRALVQADDLTRDIGGLAKLDYSLGIFTFIKQ